MYIHDSLYYKSFIIDNIKIFMVKLFFIGVDDIKAALKRQFEKVILKLP